MRCRIALAMPAQSPVLPNTYTSLQAGVKSGPKYLDGAVRPCGRSAGIAIAMRPVLTTYEGCRAIALNPSLPALIAPR
jgi:hypothetical protein